MQTQTSADSTEEDTQLRSIADVRHVYADNDGTPHIIAHEDADFALCGRGVVNLHVFGKPATTPERAVQLGAWVNVRDNMCEDCADEFDDAIWGAVEAERGEN